MENIIAHCHSQKCFINLQCIRNPRRHKHQPKNTLTQQTHTLQPHPSSLQHTHTHILRTHPHIYKQVARLQSRNSKAGCCFLLIQPREKRKCANPPLHSTSLCTSVSSCSYCIHRFSPAACYANPVHYIQDSIELDLRQTHWGTMMQRQTAAQKEVCIYRVCWLAQEHLY